MLRVGPRLEVSVITPLLHGLHPSREQSSPPRPSLSRDDPSLRPSLCAPSSSSRHYTVHGAVAAENMLPHRLLALLGLLLLCKGKTTIMISVYISASSKLKRVALLVVMDQTWKHLG